MKDAFFYCISCSFTDISLFSIEIVEPNLRFWSMHLMQLESRVLVSSCLATWPGYFNFILSLETMDEIFPIVPRRLIHVVIVLTLR